MAKQIIRELWRGAASPANMQKFIQKAQSCSDGIQKLVQNGQILGMSLFRWEQHVFLYYECIDDVVLPSELLGQAEDYLEKWPGSGQPRAWVELVDVFHFNQPANLDHWKRKSIVEKHVGKIGKLKPECIPHYMFYHYALQEERAFGGDKYQILGLNENILFGYFEVPEVVEKSIAEPRIHTRIVPEKWADAGISACFIPWSDRIGTPEERLRLMDEVVSIWL